MSSSDQGLVEVGVGELTEVRKEERKRSTMSERRRRRRSLAGSLGRRRRHRANSFFFQAFLGAAVEFVGHVLTALCSLGEVCDIVFCAFERAI